MQHESYCHFKKRQVKIGVCKGGPKGPFATLAGLKKYVFSLFLRKIITFFGVLIGEQGPSINDVAALGGGGIKGFVTTIIKSVTICEGVSKIIKNYVTSFMDDPIVYVFALSMRTIMTIAILIILYFIDFVRKLVILK